MGDLSLEQLARIDHIFVSHSHLDHVASIPFLVDTVCWMRERPITVYGTRETLDILRAHLFNWKLWPDFTQIPDATLERLQGATRLKHLGLSRTRVTDAGLIHTMGLKALEWLTLSMTQISDVGLIRA